MTTTPSQSCEDYKPHDHYICCLLTDVYQLTMAYAYWKNSSHNTNAVFDLFFRKCPFKGEFCIFAGLDEVLRYLNSFKFTNNQIIKLKEHFPNWDHEFWLYLETIDAKPLCVLAHREGSIVFPRIPLIRVEGPLILCQLIETTLLNLVNFASLVATNAARLRYVVGDSIQLSEFGLRRAQGCNGAMSASKYSYIGGFDRTSNLYGGIEYDIPLSGTHAHSFVSAFNSLGDVKYHNPKINCSFIERANYYLNQLHIMNSKSQEAINSAPNQGELAAFIAYANAYPSNFLALIDTYDTLGSGLINFLVVALVLNENGFKPLGIRLDSGDLSYLSKECRKKFMTVSKYFNVKFENLTIVASNDINEEALYSLKTLGHEVNSFGIGTHLVTCQKQPALGGVYKLVEIAHHPKIKVSEDAEKVTIPGKKLVFRLIDKNEEPILDLMTLEDSNHKPKKGQKIRCIHPFTSSKRCDVIPTKVEPLLVEVWNKGIKYQSPSLHDIRKYSMGELKKFREDYKRLSNPTPYKVSVTPDLFDRMHKLWNDELPVREFS